jgi:predicted MFS family arabinose efflux permease
MIRRTIFTSVPWFLMDIATYGVGVFTPTLLAAIAFDGAGESFIQKDIISTEGTALLDVFLVLGFGAAILLVDRLGRIRLQLTGFAVMAVALTVLGAAELFPGKGTAHIAVIGVAFAFFNFFMNMGPNATTFALPAEVYPSEMRAAGHGFAAGMAKLGAAFGVFLFPILLDSLGTSTTLFLVAGTSVVALGVTYAFRIETKGKSLDEISGHTASALDPRPAPP